ncbi:hypothetical protein LPJ66_005894 [Kickxella alabastrina]|uniref:Uncharacterized protein n=1 Tax=Kickxella alabastrina TaxID=61397 RepID=A0ACC1IDA8_9FUNG|nr:hypothetical protein LPJ66_005894 [Kickxella alabastrina]
MKEKYADQDDDERELKMALSATTDQLAALMVVDNPATVATSGAPEDIDNDDNIVDAASDQQLDVLDMLTAAPLPGDNLTSATPVCAPYSALSPYKYRMKLVPDTMKKGKACKMALTVALGGLSMGPSPNPHIRWILRRPSG